MTTIRSNPTALPTFTRRPDLSELRVDQRQQFNDACKVMQQHFKEIDGFFGDGLLDMNELYACAQGQKGGPEAQQAARFLLAHPDMLGELDQARNKDGKLDGKISGSDLSSQISSLDREQQVKQLRYDPRLGDFQNSLSTLAKYWSQVDEAGAGFFSTGPDGLISQKDLDAVMTNPNAPLELRQAAFFLSTNPDLMGMLDTAAYGGDKDGLVSVADLNTLNQQIQGLRPPFPPFRPPYQVY